MKKPITLVLALLTFASVAQYNNTYDVNSNGDNLTPSFVITNKKAESITVSYASDGASLPRNDYFILTKHDASGSVLYNNRLDAYFAKTDGLTSVEALIQTDDEGVLVAGYHYDDAHFIEQPFLLKVDVNGNFLWVRLYYVNRSPINRSETNKMSLCRVYDDTEEHYFIVGSADSDANSGIDVTTNVIKVDDKGGLIFSKKYYDSHPQFSELREYPGDIEFSKPDGMYMITGYREDYTPNVGGRPMMYFFGIDNTGAVVTKFMTLQSKSVPLDQDMIFDPNTKRFITTFTHEKNGYVSSASSIIGFIAIDANLTISNPKYLWHKEGSRHNGRSISLCKSGEYLLCSGVLDNYSTYVNNPAWLKVDVSGKPTTGLLRYNLKDDTYFGHHATTYNTTTGEDEYVMVNERKTDLRVIRTDINGKACGVEKFEPYDKEYEPQVETYKYYDREVGDIKKYKVYEKFSHVEYRKCEGDGSSYRTAGLAQLAEVEAQNSVVLYPSVISAANAFVTVENNSGVNAKLEIYTIAGQLIFSNNQVSQGKSEVKLATNGTLSVGIYMVKTYGVDGKLTSTSKILITE